ncbi:MAG: hypothetical protein PVJ62_05090 [Deltaproteobacteria bacterium]|jgi:hypothetical protein
MEKEIHGGQPPLRPGISTELRLDIARKQKIKKDHWSREEKLLEQSQKARIKEIYRRILKDEDFNKQKKADKKIGGVRGKFHPSLDRTRKRT